MPGFAERPVLFPIYRLCSYQSIRQIKSIWEKNLQKYHITFPLASRCEVEIATWWGMGAWVHFLPLSTRTQTISNRQCAFCHSPCDSWGHCFLDVIHSLWLLDSLYLLFHTAPLTWRNPFLPLKFPLFHHCLSHYLVTLVRLLSYVHIF